ncbi:hypothetical protein IPZ58_32245 [Streptomyces roseoverticillatus]|uniref:hypothetical protein n=1 Tax=Streptomyces roseoverticillatus TaxID=66429 RepID=UPI001F28761E|nr:hypothetical protein [Streptomyces roseoverticillatus]MCF3106209.1 hypothetical protein [Streptomyces roseoverticillatus]
MTDTPGNPLFVRARIAQGLHTQEEFTEAFEGMAHELGLKVTVSVRQVRRWESRKPGWPHPPARAVLQALLRSPAEELGFTRPVRNAGEDALAAPPHDGPVKRRDFVTYSLAAVGGVSVPSSADEIFAQAVADPLDRLRSVLTGAVGCRNDPSAPEALAQASASAKRQVQRCHYSGVGRRLPDLLVELEPRRGSAEDQFRVDRAAVEAYHVAASLLLKNDDAPSAWVAAEKAMAAARRTEDAVAVASASRILTHAVTAVGHHRQGVGVAVRVADEVAGGVTRSSPGTVAVFGALLLRGAWAASVADDRDMAEELLNEAGRAAQLLEESNLQGTAFGANNVLLHRVSIALTLGDAGRALAEAREVDVTALAVAERRAVFWTDVARALHACGRTERATAALLAAEKEAPEEVRSRPVVRELIGDLLMRDRGGRVPVLRSLASRAQVAV